MPKQWNDELDRKLLLIMIDPSGGYDWKVIAEKMGEGFTAEACRQHFSKIKKNTSSGAGSSDEQQPSTPAKGAKPAKVKTKRANDQAIEAQGTKEESGEGLPSPTKKRRGRQPGTPAKSKTGEPKKRGKSASAAKFGESENETGGKAEEENNASATHSDTGEGVELPM